MTDPTSQNAPTPAGFDARSALLGHLEGQRRHVLGIIDGLSAEDLARPVLPSGWSIASLLHHLALDDERFWVRAVIGGDQDAQDTLSDNGWILADGMTPHDAVALYLAESESSRQILESADLDAAPAWWPSFMGDRWLDTNADVVMHLLAETATHAGHLDAARELLDGRQWMVITE